MGWRISLLLLFFTGAAAGGTSVPDPPAAATGYVCAPCPFRCHDVVYSQPGTCPVCDMKLVTSDTPGKAAGYTTRSVTYESGELRLGALLYLPQSSAPLRAAVILQGSGDSDRHNLWSRQIADLLARQGTAALLTDKRGCGESQGSWKTAGFEDLAGDAVAGVEFLRGLPEVDGDRVGLVGLSQGGKVAPVAAAGSPHVAFIVSISSGATSFIESAHFEMQNTARQQGLSEADVRQVLQIDRAAMGYARTGDWRTYETLRKRGLESEWRRLAEGYPASREDPIWTFFGKALHFQPMTWWALLDRPVLILMGESDDEDNVAVSESVRRFRFLFETTGHPSHEIVVFPGAGHSLLDATRTRFVPGFEERLTAWLRQHVGNE